MDVVELTAEKHEAGSTPASPTSGRIRSIIENKGTGKDMNIEALEQFRRAVAAGAMDRDSLDINPSPLRQRDIAVALPHKFIDVINEWCQNHLPGSGYWAEIPDTMQGECSSYTLVSDNEFFDNMQQALLYVYSGDYNPEAKTSDEKYEYGRMIYRAQDNTEGHAEAFGMFYDDLEEEVS